MKNNEIEFDAHELIGSVEGIRDHLAGKKKLTLRQIKVELPDPAPQVTPEEIRATRESLQVSQPVFARILNVPTVTAVSWEKGRRKPSGAALRLLQIVRKNPDVLLHS